MKKATPSDTLSTIDEKRTAHAYIHRLHIDIARSSSRALNPPHVTVRAR